MGSVFLMPAHFFPNNYKVVYYNYSDVYNYNHFILLSSSVYVCLVCQCLSSLFSYETTEKCNVSKTR